MLFFLFVLKTSVLRRTEIAEKELGLFAISLAYRVSLPYADLLASDGSGMKEFYPSPLRANAVFGSVRGTEFHFFSARSSRVMRKTILRALLKKNFFHLHFYCSYCSNDYKKNTYIYINIYKMRYYENMSVQIICTIQTLA